MAKDMENMSVKELEKYINTLQKNINKEADTISTYTSKIKTLKEGCCPSVCEELNTMIKDLSEQIDILEHKKQFFKSISDSHRSSSIIQGAEHHITDRIDQLKSLKTKLSEKNICRC